MAVRARVRTAMNVLGRFGGYRDLGSVPVCEKQEHLLNVASETVTRYLLGEIDEDSDFDGLDIMCLDIASKIRLDPEWNALDVGDRFVVRHSRAETEDGAGYILWLDKIKEQGNGEDQVRSGGDSDAE